MLRVIAEGVVPMVAAPLVQVEEHDSDSYSETGWTSSEDDDEDEEGAGANEESEDEEARQARTLAQIRVLHAAGLLVPANDADDEATASGVDPRVKPEIPDRLLKRRKTKKVRPDRPKRAPSSKKKRPDRPLPAAPQPEENLEDAYDRFVRISKEATLLPAATPVLPPPSAEPSIVASISPDLPGEGRGSGFLGSIKSKSKGRDSDRRTAPRISGPMSGPSLMPGTPKTQRDVSGIGAASGGASWSDLVGSAALEMIPDRERKRQEAIFELILTENSHVRDLQIIVEVYFNSMQSLISDKASTVIFANIEDVLLAAVSFLSDLEDRQRESRLYIDHVGDILTNHMPNMQAYLPYCVNQSTAAEILKSERQRDPSIGAHLANIRATNPIVRNLDLSSFLLIPMQRITRYPLLIEQVLRHTEPDHPDHAALQSALASAQALLNKTNESIRAGEEAELLRKLSETLYIGQARLDLTRPTRWGGERRVLKQELLSKAKSGRKVHALLCSDMLLLLVPDRDAPEAAHSNGSLTELAKSGAASLYHLPLPLEEVSVRELVGKLTGRDESGFTLLHHARGGPGGGAGKDDKVNLKAGSPRAAHAWMHAIEQAKMDAARA